MPFQVLGHTILKSSTADPSVSTSMIPLQDLVLLNDLFLIIKVRLKASTDFIVLSVLGCVMLVIICTN